MFRPASLLLLVCCPFLLYSYYCPYQHRHVGRNILRLRGEEDDVGRYEEQVVGTRKEQELTTPPSLPTASFWTAEKYTREKSNMSTYCPTGCVCNNTYDIIKVTCRGQFLGHFPIDMLPQDTSILDISPDKVPNQLTLGPTIRMLRHLSFLSITHSSIPNIGQRTLWGLSNLRSLNLSHNAISHIVESNFDGLISLTSLVLDNNPIKSITSAAFHHLPRLELLSLAHNQLTELAPRIFYKLNTLKVIDLSSNNLLVLDEEVFKDIRNIQQFSCNSCGLNSFKVGFSLRFLRKLELAGNKLETLEDIEAHVLRGLNILDISENMITEVRKVESEKMDVLKIAKNKIRRIDQCAFCQTRIIDLDLSYNYLTHIASVFPHKMEFLTLLNLSGNMIPVEEMLKTFKNLPNLDSIHLAETGLVSIPIEIFQDNPNLKLVNVSSNYLVDLDKEIISSLPKLTYLDLSHNLFMGLEKSFLMLVDAKPKLLLVYLQNNPWVCDKCHLQPLFEWLHTSLMYWGSCFPPNSPMCLLCSSPSSLNHTPISSLEILPDCSPSEPPGFKSMTSVVTSLSQYMAICVLLAVLLIILVMVVTKYRHYGVYLTGEEEDKENSILTNPVTVLDKNSESYIDLRYPTQRR